MLIMATFPIRLLAFLNGFTMFFVFCFTPPSSAAWPGQTVSEKVDLLLAVYPKETLDKVWAYCRERKRQCESEWKKAETRGKLTKMLGGGTEFDKKMKEGLYVKNNYETASKYIGPFAKCVVDSYRFKSNWQSTLLNLLMLERNGIGMGDTTSKTQMDKMEMQLNELKSDRLSKSTSSLDKMDKTESDRLNKSNQDKMESERLTKSTSSLDKMDKTESDRLSKQIISSDQKNSNFLKSDSKNKSNSISKKKDELNLDKSTTKGTEQSAMEMPSSDGAKLNKSSRTKSNKLETIKENVIRTISRGISRTNSGNISRTNSGNISRTNSGSISRTSSDRMSRTSSSRSNSTDHVYTSLASLDQTETKLATLDEVSLAFAKEFGMDTAEPKLEEEDQAKPIRLEKTMTLAKWGHQKQQQANSALPTEKACDQLETPTTPTLDQQRKLDDEIVEFGQESRKVTELALPTSPMGLFSPTPWPSPSVAWPSPPVAWPSPPVAWLSPPVVLPSSPVAWPSPPVALSNPHSNPVAVPNSSSSSYRDGMLSSPLSTSPLSDVFSVFSHEDMALYSPRCGGHITMAPPHAAQQQQDIMVQRANSFLDELDYKINNEMEAFKGLVDANKQFSSVFNIGKWELQLLKQLRDFNLLHLMKAAKEQQEEVNKSTALNTRGESVTH